jgi:hypothetical protein
MAEKTTTASKKAGKFASAIVASDKNIKDARAAIIEKGAKRAAENLVRSLEDEVDELEVSILNLTDLAPDTTYSLRPGGKDFDAEGWVSKLHEAKLEIALKKIELGQAEDILKEWF